MTLFLALSVRSQTFYWNRNDVLSNDKDFNRTYNWSANQNGTGARPTSDRDDDFTDNTLGSAWTYLDKVGDGQSSYSLTTNADKLTLSARGADTWAGDNAYNVIYQTYNGNFEVSVKIESQTNTNAWAKAGLIVANDFTTLASGGYVSLAITPSNGITFQYDIAGNVGEFEANVTNGGTTPTFPTWIRLVKNGLAFTAWYKTAIGNSWTQIGSAQTPQTGKLISHVGLFACSHNTGQTGAVVFDDWQGGGKISATGLDLSLNGSGGNADANAVVSADVNVASLDLTGYTGTLAMGGDNGLFATYYDNEDLTGTSVAWVDSTVNIDWGGSNPSGLSNGDSWTGVWEGYVVPQFSETYTFYVNADDRLRLWVNGQKLFENWTGCVCTEQAATSIALTAGQRYPILIQFREDAGSAKTILKWQSGSMVNREVVPKRALFAGHINVTGNVNFPSGTVSAQDGLLEFSGTGGTQAFTPRSGQNMPRILHSGASTLQLSSNALTTFGFNQSAGSFDFNGLNLTVSSNGPNRGDLMAWNGTASSFANLGGRTVTVAGNASFVGTSLSSRINLNPGSGWTLAVTGQLNARYADISNSNASVAAGTAYRSGSGGSNTNWTVNGQTWYWDRNEVISTSTDFSKAYNWAYNADGTGIRPFSTTDDWFDNPALGSAWTYKDRDGDETYGGYRITGGQLALTGEGGDVWNGTNEFATVYRSDITGNFDVQVKLVSVSTTGGTTYKVGLMMADDFNTLGSGGYAKLNYQGTPNLEFSRDESGNVGEIESNSTATPGALPIWLRLIKNGTSVTAWYKSTENGSWFQVGAAATPQSTAANSQVGLFVCGFAGGVATAVFDHFQGGTTLATSDDYFNFAGSGSGADANATLSRNQTAQGIDFTGYTGTFNFGSYTLGISTANAAFVAGQGLTAGTGTLAFTGTSGTQVFTPKSGATFPAVTKTGASILQLSTNNLSTASYTQSAGTLDFNGVNLTTTSSGDFTVTNGTGASFANLGGRTVTVAGDASITGTPGDLANLVGTAWTITATGTLSADYANIQNGTASAATGLATNSVNGGGNVNWNFGTQAFSAWSYSTRIGFNTTATGANVANAVANFPLLVRLDANNFDFTQAKSDGSDLRFTDPDGSLLSHEMERWDAANKKAELWVRVPQVDGNSDRDYITLYWGNNAATAVSNGEAVFDTTLGYEAVWHMNTGRTDATANGLNLNDVGGSLQDTGAISEGRSLNGTSTNLTRASAAALNMTSAITLSAWIKPLDWIGGNRRILQKGATDNQYRLYRTGSVLSFHLFGLSSGATLNTPSLPSLGQWHLVTATYNGSASKIYFDGVEVATQAASGSIGTSSDGMDVGMKYGGGTATDRFLGTLDETVIASTALSADHVKLAYESQKPGSVFLAFPNTQLSTWSYSTKIYVNTTASGANITSDQANFPLLVRLTRGNFNFDQALTTGADLRFADSSGNLLPYEIERFDATAKAADVWVLLPSVKANNNSQWFRMYWGKGRAASLSSGPAVFLGSAGFAGVWHLGEDGSTTSGAYKDATGFKNAGSGIAMTNASDVAAVVGVGSHFATGSNQGIHVPNAASLYSAGALTLEAWVNPTSKTNYLRIAGKPFSSNGAPWNQFDLELDGSATKFSFSLTVGGTEASVQNTTTLNNGTWYHVAGVYDGSTQKAYCNGLAEASTARSGTVNDYGAPFAIGKYYHGTGSNWDGKIDEVRLSTVARSADWMKLAYENMKTGSAVAQVGNRSREFAKSVQLGFNTTASGANVSGNVAGIPILVRLTSANFDFTAVRDDGSDLQFIDKDGSFLYHEVAEWDKGNKVGKVWVKVPQVDGNSASDFITLYYGCAACTGSPYAVDDSVWSGYTSVYHLKSPEARAMDAALLNNHAVYQQDMPNSPGLVSANAPFFDGVSAYVEAPNESNYDFTSNISVSAWIKVPSFTTTWAPIVTKSDQNFRLHRYNNTSGASFAVNKASTAYNAFGTGAIDDGAWHLVTGVYDGANVKVYLDGVVGSTAPALTGSIDNDNQTVRIGHNSTATGRFWNGNISDVRISNNSAVLSADFIKLSYQNQKAADALISYPISTASFSGSRAYKLNTTASGANVAGDVFNFPLLLRITGSTIVDAAQNGAPDIRFLDDDGVTWLDYSIERWDKTTDSAEVWVRKPRVRGNGTGDYVTLYYGQNGVTVPDGQCASCVFNASNGYVAAWHMAEAGNNTADNFVNAVGNGYHGAGNSLVAASSVSALSGKGLSLDGGADWFGTSGTPVLAGMPLTISGWAYRAGTGSGDYLFSQGTTSAGAGLHFGYRNTNAFTFAFYSDDMNTVGTYPALNTWTHWTGTFDPVSKTRKIYYNGALETSGTSSGQYTGSGVVRVGNSAWGGDDFNGTLDEVNVSTVVRSADWIKLSYQSQRRDASPLFNPSPADFTSSRKYTFNTTRTGANVMGDVADFPLLVRITGSTLVDAVQNDYDDIRFLDGDGKTWLNYKVERWDKSADTAEVWVLVPKVDGNSDHDFITLYYNDVSNGAVANGECGSCVFGTATGFTGVWHMDDNAASTAMTEEVSATATTLYNDNITDNTSGHSTAGVIGRSINFMGGAAGTGGGVQKENFRHTLAWPKTSGTVSHWLKADQARTMAALYESDGTSASYDGLTHPADILEAHTGAVGSNWAAIYQDGNNVFVNPSGGTVTPGAWTHVTASWSRTDSMYLFVDGVRVAAQDMASKAFGSKTPTIMQFGRMGNASDTRHWDGTADEIQISNVQRGPDWIRLSYATQKPLASNTFWNARPGPNNITTLTATDAGGSIALSWTTPVSDSSAAVSVGIWLRYTGLPDSVGAAGQTRVVILPKTDSAYAYPAVYPGTYYFALAVRNASGQWSPFTNASSDTVTQGGSVFLTDTVYVDSAIGNNSNTCVQAQNPATPKLTIVSAMGCESSAIHDSLVVRVMPGTYTDNDLDPNVKPQVVTSFDVNSRAILHGSKSLMDGATRTATVVLRNDVTLKGMDVKCSVNDYIGVYIFSGDANSRVEGCRIYNKDASTRHHDGITWLGNANNNIHVANNLIYQPLYSGIYITADNSYNVVNNTLIGDGSLTHRAIHHNASAAGYTDMTIANNIAYNWDYGITTVSANVGVVSNNLFHLVTTGHEVTVTSDANKILKDPLFAGTNPTDRHGFKLLPGSPAIDAGTASYAGGGQAVPHRSATDLFGSIRTLGAATDIGAYEGTGHTATPAGEFDSLTTSATATTVTVENSKWKLIFDKASGGGINAFYDKTTAPSTNLLAASSTLFDVKIDAYTASGVAAVIAPSFAERTRARAIVRQRLPVSASLDLNVYYTIYPSGHVYVESELSNLSASTLAVGTLDYTLKLGTTTAAFASGGTKNGFGYLTSATRDAAISATRDLDGGAASAETWSASAAVSGSPGTVIFKTTDLIDIAKNHKRRHDFLLYLGDNALDFTKAATLNADAYAPSPLSASAGSLLMERSWQEGLMGHWTLDDGAGASARDKAVYFQNNAALTGAGARWVSGKVGGGLYLTAADVATVTDNAILEAARGMTVMFWIKPDFSGTGATAYVISKGLTSSDGWNFRKVSGQNQLTFTMGAATVTTPTLTDGAWSHIAVVCWSNGSFPVEMFVNGVLTGASTVSATAAANAANLLFGYSAGAAAADKFQGTLDDIRIYRNEIYAHDIQSIYNRGFSSKHGHYALRADNNNRVVALINEGAAQTRVQPAFQIANWFGPKTPKFVYLDGVRLKPNTDFSVDSVGNPEFGAYLVLQLNSILTGESQTLFIDDDDSTGYLGEAAKMKQLTISATANDKLTFQNFTGSTFGSASSGQWYTEIDLNGWTTWNTMATVDQGFGEFNVWKAAAINPNLAVSGGTNQVGIDDKSGRTLTHFKFDDTGNDVFSSGVGYAGPANIGYTLADSSATRISMTLSAMSMQGSDGTFTLTKRWTVYPTGRIFGSFVISASTFNFDDPAFDIVGRFNASPAKTWVWNYADNNSRYGWMGGDLDFHSIVGGVTSVKSGGAMVSDLMDGGTSTTQEDGTGGLDYRRARLSLQDGDFTAAKNPVTVNFFVDISRDFTDSATADSLAKDVQTPAVLTAISGTRTTNDALDFNADNFAEGDGAYTFAAAATGIAHFKFVNTVTSFYPAFRINTWTFGTLPEFVVLDNQVLIKDYQYNAYLNAASNEVIIQFNKTLAPGTHVFYISHKSGLAVKLSSFEAKGGEGVDTLLWTTESEFENLGYNVYRRVAAAQFDSALADGAPVAGAGIANALMGAARTEAAKRAAAKLALGQHLAQSQAVAGDSLARGGSGDSLPSQKLTAEELAALGFERVNPRLIPGAKGGSSASTQKYVWVDRTAAFGVTYEYLLESVDFNGNREQYGPRTARPSNPLTTELQSNYPNPFNPITTLRFSLKEKLKVSLIIYDSKGSLVRTLVRGDKAMLPGKYRLVWDARDNSGFEVPSGQYFYRFTAGRYVKARKMILVK
jgi:hypothetical protein